METTGQPKVGFVGWNPFQFLHFGRIASRFENPAFVIEERRGISRFLDSGPALSGSPRILNRSRKEMLSLDGEFDVLVCQTPFAGIERIRKSRIAMLQYGYAKEAHNFAPWRSFADLCITFGHYAERKIGHFCPAVSVGNPRYEDWAEEAFHVQARQKFAGILDPEKKTILYAPTWGALSSIHSYAEEILALTRSHNVIFKLHHNTQLTDPQLTSSIRKKFGHICGADDDIVELLSVSDVMITDYSGAIFDAIYCEVPIVLINSASSAGFGSSTSDIHSIERARRDELGEIVTATTELAPAVQRTLENPGARLALLENLRSELFVDPANSSSRIAGLISDLADGRFQQTQLQGYVREEMRSFYQCRSELSAARSVGGFLQMTVEQIQRKLQGPPE